MANMVIFKDTSFYFDNGMVRNEKCWDLQKIKTANEKGCPTMDETGTGQAVVTVTSETIRNNLPGRRDGDIRVCFKISGGPLQKVNRTCKTKEI